MIVIICFFLYIPSLFKKPWAGIDFVITLYSPKQNYLQSRKSHKGLTNSVSIFQAQRRTVLLFNTEYIIPQLPTTTYSFPFPPQAPNFSPHYLFPFSPFQLLPSPLVRFYPVFPRALTRQVHMYIYMLKGNKFLI